MQLVIINMLNLKLLLYFPFFLLSYFLFLLPGTAKPEVIFPTCPSSSISELLQLPLFQTKLTIDARFKTYVS